MPLSEQCLYVLMIVMRLDVTIVECEGQLLL